MKRMIVSAVTILFSGGVLLSGATGAFFSDTETSTGNMFTAGAIDLKIDNDSYYNGNRCTFLDAQATTSPGFYWQGNASYPVVGSPCNTSFPESDLGNGLLFFNFNDIKPDDEGEDTISLHVQNDAYACLDMSLTSDDDKSSTEPELGDGDVQNTDDAWDGELADTVQMFWWADDGDNVYEEGENQITNGVQTITNMFGDDKKFSIPLADTQNNAWGNDGPIPAGTVYIAKAWCMGTMTLSPVPGNGGVNPSVDPGVDCDGTTLNNLTQTDGLTMDIAFRAEQARHNDRFLCDENTRLATIKVVKQVTNDNGGNNVVADFQLFVDNGVVTTPVSSGMSVNVAPGAYSVSETGVSGYVGTYGGDCDAFGNVTLAPGDNKTCTITNDDLPGNITLIKNVTGTPPLAGPSTFGLTIDGSPVPNNTSVPVNSNVAHAISEIGRVGYSFVNITGSAKCPAVLGGTATLDEGEAITCTITNNKN